MDASILIVDDEKNIRRTLTMVLEGVGHTVHAVDSAEAAFLALQEQDVDLMVLDVRLPGMSGVEALKRIRQQSSHASLPVIMVSGHASLAEAVHSVQLGANDFLEKPLDRDRLIVSVNNALHSNRLERELTRLRAEVADRYEMLGETPVMKELYGAIEKVAPTRGRVLITGESGTGKELIARAIHRLSDRVDKPFVMLNCAAIPAELIESELFGHERGAFTGAHGRKKGLFEVADGGTLFLDEIGDMSTGAQAKVLRALQSGEISRVGGERAIAIDVRVLAATNKDLEAEVEQGNFRDDLFFRLNVVPIYCPALRDRPDDIPILAAAFFEEFCREYGGRYKAVEPRVYEMLKARPWPGNVRELRNVTERMVILSGHEITAQDVPQNSSRGVGAASEAPPASQPSGFVVPVEEPDSLSLREFRDRAEEAYIRATLDTHDWNISRAAVRLRVERTNLHKKMRSFGIKRA